MFSAMHVLAANEILFPRFGRPLQIVEGDAITMMGIFYVHFPYFSLPRRVR